MRSVKHLQVVERDVIKYNISPVSLEWNFPIPCFLEYFRVINSGYDATYEMRGLMICLNNNGIDWDNKILLNSSRMNDDRYSPGTCEKD